MSLSPSLTAWTGLDALTHAIETLCVPDYHPMSDGIALEAVRLIRDWLPAAVEDGSDLGARGHMLTAAMMGGVAFCKGLGAVHALSHPIGAVFDTHHGRTNAVYLPYVLAYNRPHIEDKLDRLARYLNLEGPGFDALMAWILELRARYDVPHTAHGLGVENAAREDIAAKAAIDVCASTNPIPVDVEVARTIFDNAMSGRLE